MSNSESSSGHRAKILKYLTLVLVTLQTSVTVLVLRYSRLKGPDDSEPNKYSGTTLVFMTEIVKYGLCLVLLLIQNRCSFPKSVKILYKEVLLNNYETAKLAVPSTLYTVQNNLLIVALSNLDAATYQVTYQLKILTTALFSVLLLKKQLSGKQWIALLLLMVGVIFVQMPAERNPTDGALSFGSPQRLIGLVSVLLSCLSSGFAGVYYEKLLKEGPQPSIIIMNLKLGLFSLFFGAIGVVVTDWDNIMKSGFFHGYSPVVWTVIALQACGGLIVSATVKYADNILKGFATSISIILSSLYSYFVLRDLHISVTFLYGMLLVIGATFLYGVTPKKTDVRSSEERELEKELLSDKKVNMCV